MTKDEAPDLALEALEIQAYNSGDEKYNSAITAIKQARSAPVQEPVAQSLKDAVFTVLEGFTLPHDVRKLLEAAYYTPPAAQRQFVGLEREIAAAVLDHCYGHGGVSDDMIERTTEVIEAKLKEKP